MSKEYIISIDLGGTKILSALINKGGEIFAKSKISTDVKSGKAGLIKGLLESVSSVLEEGNLKIDDIRAISLGVPGSVNPFTGKIGVAPNLNISNFNIKTELEKYFAIPVLVENDVNLAALGIKEFELKEKGNNILVAFIGTGIGGALILDKKLYRGTANFAGEIGHMHMLKNGPMCGCGKKGCLEAIASRTAIVRNIKKDLKDKKNTKLRALFPDGKPIKSKGLSLAIKKNNPTVVREITDACNIIGIALGNITNLLNLDMIVLGGGVIEAMDKFMIPRIKESFKKTVLTDAGRGVKIIATKLGDDAALYGGIALAEEMGIK
ncbi:MAG: ROK family protein [Ignavibacteriales bacterium]